MDVSVIIINYNTLELTKNTINSVIEKTKGLEYEIILVDNASTDGSIDFFEKEYKNKIVFIKNNENLGFGKANNKGVEIAKGKYVFLLNSDTLLINNAIKILFDFMEKNNNCGACGGNLYSENLKPDHSTRFELPYMTLKTEIDLYLNFPKMLFLKLLKKRNDFNYSNFPKKVGYIVGADLMLKKDVFLSVGGFDSDFFMYHEEVELLYRIVKKDYSIFSIPEAKIIHLGGKSGKFKEKTARMVLEGKYKYFYKCFGLKECKYLYYIIQTSNFLKAMLRPQKQHRDMLKINKEEYNKFLLNYHTLRRNNL